MRRYKSNTFPASPINGEQIIDAFQDERVLQSFGFTNHENRRKLYKGTIVEEYGTATFFASELVMQMIDENIPKKKRRYLMDATFKIVPVGCFKQLLIIYVEYIGKVSRAHKIYSHSAKKNTLPNQFGFCFLQ